MTDLNVTAGLPFSRRIRVVDGKNIWATLDALEVRSQIRAGKSPTSELKGDLRPFLTLSFDTNDLVIDLVMTGAETMDLPGGEYDIIVSDVGTVDARAIRVLFGSVRKSQLVTTPEGDSV